MSKNNFEILHFNEIDSTNVYAKNLVLSNHNINNTIIIADKQTNGKTTKNTNWISPVGNLYVTYIMKLKENEEKFFHQLSFITAISLIETITQKFDNTNIKLKWPNDILLNNKKLSGILIEKEGLFSIIGVGININSNPDRNYTRYPSTNLLSEDCYIEKNDLLNIFTKNLINNINICKEYTFSKIIKNIIPYLYKLNENIIFNFNNNIFIGKFIGINCNGALLLNIDSEVKTFYSGEFTKENFIDL